MPMFVTFQKIDAEFGFLLVEDGRGVLTSRFQAPSVDGLQAEHEQWFLPRGGFTAPVRGVLGPGDQSWALTLPRILGAVGAAYVF